MINHSPIIGLTGGIGSGKSTIAKCFNELGIQSVDADNVARLVVQQNSYCLNKIQQRHGNKILLDDGTLNRNALRKIIFDQPEEKIWLENLTHPVIREEIQKQLSQISSKYSLLVHPLLFETKQNSVCQLVIAIDVPVDIQVQRVINRDKIDKSSAEKIMATQLSNKDRVQRADLILENSGGITEMNAKVLKLHQEILESLPC